MDEFIVSARKYRPLTFDTVIGQESITQTLEKAIKNNHLAQAFLFNGPRGVGKTTCARILAREVNHFHSEGMDEGNDFSFNIFELDAASNNKVEDIRNLIDQVRIPPQIGKYKVYIIDEVHMLSASAFNAFLKTLEEPPSYAIFILATTEKHKVLPTIISRCQVFDFNRIGIGDMVEHLKSVANKEGISVEDEALHVISEKADGAMRDALSIFDQMVSFSGNQVGYQDVIDNLNILDYDYYFALGDNFLESDTASVITTFNKILSKGFDGHNFINGLANHFRRVLMCMSPQTANILEAGESIKNRYIEQAPRFESAKIVTALEILGKADIDYRLSRNQRLMVEVLLLKLCSLFGNSEETEKKNDNSVAHIPMAPPSGTTPKEIPISKTVAEPGPKVDAAAEQPRTQTLVETVEEPVITKGPIEKSSIEENLEQNIPVKDEKREQLDQPNPQVKGIFPNESKKETSASPNEKKEASFRSKLSNKRLKGITSLSSIEEDIRNGGAKGNSGEIEIDLNPNNNKPSDSFTLQELWDAWKLYAAGIKAADKQSYYATLTKHDPVMREENVIELLVDNHVQLKDLETDKANLLEFLRERLNNWQITLKGVIDEDSEKNDDSLYEPGKKFEAMLEKNPDLLEFKKRFDLDVDYDT